MARQYEYHDDSDYEYRSSSVSDKLTFLLVGGGIGAIIALLFAPKSGVELRGDIADATRKGYDKTREAADQLKQRSGDYYEEARHMAGNVYNRAGEAYRAAKGELTRAADQADDAVQRAGEQVGETAKNIGQKVGNTVQKTGNEMAQEIKRQPDQKAL